MYEALQLQLVLGAALAACVGLVAVGCVRIVAILRGW